MSRKANEPKPEKKQDDELQEDELGKVSGGQSQDDGERGGYMPGSNPNMSVEINPL